MQESLGRFRGTIQLLFAIGRPSMRDFLVQKKGYPAARPVRLAREVPKEIRSLDRKCSRHRSTEG